MAFLRLISFMIIYFIINVDGSDYERPSRNLQLVSQAGSLRFFQDPGLLECRD